MFDRNFLCSFCLDSDFCIRTAVGFEFVHKWAALQMRESLQPVRRWRDLSSTVEPQKPPFCSDKSPSAFLSKSSQISNRVWAAITWLLCFQQFELEDAGMSDRLMSVSRSQRDSMSSPSMLLSAAGSAWLSQGCFEDPSFVLNLTQEETLSTQQSLHGDGQNFVGLGPKLHDSELLNWGCRVLPTRDQIRKRKKRLTV